MEKRLEKSSEEGSEESQLFRSELSDVYERFRMVWRRSERFEHVTLKRKGLERSVERNLESGSEWIWEAALEKSLEGSLKESVEKSLAENPESDSEETLEDRLAL